MTKKKEKEHTPYSLLTEHGKMLLDMAQNCYKRAEHHISISCHTLAGEDMKKGKEFQEWAEITLARAEKLRRMEEPEIEAPSLPGEHATYRTK